MAFLPRKKLVRLFEHQLHLFCEKSFRAHCFRDCQFVCAVCVVLVHVGKLGVEVGPQGLLNYRLVRLYVNLAREDLLLEFEVAINIVVNLQ